MGTVCGCWLWVRGGRQRARVGGQGVRVLVAVSRRRAAMTGVMGR